MNRPPLARAAVPIALLAASWAIPAAADDFAIVAARTHEVQEATGEIVVDGVLDETAWREASPISVDFEVFPAENEPAPVRTECRLLVGERHLYVGIRAEDPNPSAIRAHLTDRDRAHRNDIVGIALDPFLDARRGFAFMSNPLGVQLDARIASLGGIGGYGSLSGAPGEDYSWDAIWDSAGRIDSRGYVVEMAIPWSALRFPRGDGIQTWGIAVFRSYPRSVRHRMMSNRQDRENVCYLCQVDRVTGLRGMRAGIDVELTPTATHQITDSRDDVPEGSLERDDQSELGLTTRWGVTPNLSLSATLNPDFSQVEADAARLDVNRRFALFFPEKRPFFLEGADLFRTPVRAVYTRAVSNPDWGLKLTGKEGPHAIGAFVARDRGTDLIFPGNQGSDRLALDEDNTTSVVRYRRDVGRASNIGVLLTSREGEGEYSNRVGGIDGYLELSPTDNVRFQYLRSRTVYGNLDDDGDGTAEIEQPAGTFFDDAYQLQYAHDAREWDLWSWYQRRGPGFRADAGFVTQVDTRSYGAGIRRTFWGENGGFLSRADTSIEGFRVTDDEGLLTNEGLTLFASADGPMQSILRFNLGLRKTFYDGEYYDRTLSQIFFNIRPSGEFTSSLRIAYNDAIDLANSRAARALTIAPGITWNFGRHLFVQLDHTFRRMRVDEGWLFDANASEARIVYQFTRELFVRTILQRVGVSRDLDLYSAPEDYDEESEQLFAQFLLSYKLNPRTVVFVGFTNRRLGTDGFDTLTTDRSLFVKLGYAWVL